MTIIQDPESALRNERQLQEVSDQLAKLDLPEPSVLKTLQLKENDQKIIGDRDVKLSTMDMGDPEGLLMF